jgi:MoxR-like ATPase
MEGTYPLPEAQLDRFFAKLLVKFPKFDDMEAILDRTTEATKSKAEPVFDGERILALSRLVRQIPVAAEVRRYAIAVVMATHPDHELAAPMAKQFVRYGAARGAPSRSSWRPNCGPSWTAGTTSPGTTSRPSPR